MTRDAVIDAIARVLVHRSDVRLAYLFGSTARGSANADSDIDVAVLVDRQVDLPQLAATLAQELGQEVDLVSLEDPGVPLLQEIMRDGIVVHEGTPYAAARFRSRALLDLEIDGPWFARMRDAWLRKVAKDGLL